MRRTIPLAITFFTGMLIVVAFLIPHPPLGGLEDRFLNWYLVVVGFTMLLGVESLIRMHLKKVSNRRTGWGYSIVLLFALALTVLIGGWWVSFS